MLCNRIAGIKSKKKIPITNYKAMKLKNALCALALGLAQATVLNAAGPVYNLGSDFSINAGNPNGVWTYGYTTADGVFTSFPTAEIAYDDNGLPVELWVNPATRSAIFHNQNDRNVISNGGEGVHPPDSVWFSAIRPDQLAVAQFTAPVADKYHVSVVFTKVLQSVGDKMDVYVFVNQKKVFSGIIKPGKRLRQFTTSVRLEAGDIISFAAGTAEDGEYGDVVFVEAQIRQQ